MCVHMQFSIQVVIITLNGVVKSCCCFSLVVVGCIVFLFLFLLFCLCFVIPTLCLHSVLDKTKPFQQLFMVAATIYYNYSLFSCHFLIVQLQLNESMIFPLMEQNLPAQHI